MNTNNIEINTHSSIKIVSKNIIYFDPYKIEKESHDADIIFITHDHYDHFDVKSIQKINKENTIIVAPKSIEETINKIEFKNYIYLEPFEETTIDDINIKAIPAYNNKKEFHPKENNWLGYIITLDNITYYIAGDTDVTEENEEIKCDIVFIPIGGHFTMDVNEATELIIKINPKIVVPTHYGTIIGNKTDGKTLKENLSNTNIEVMEKIIF